MNRPGSLYRSMGLVLSPWPGPRSYQYYETDAYYEELQSDGTSVLVAKDLCRAADLHFDPLMCMAARAWVTNQRGRIYEELEMVPERLIAPGAPLQMNRHGVWRPSRRPPNALANDVVLMLDSKGAYLTPFATLGRERRELIYAAGTAVDEETFRPVSTDHRQTAILNPGLAPRCADSGSRQ